MSYSKIKEIIDGVDTEEARQEAVDAYLQKTQTDGKERSAGAASLMSMFSGQSPAAKDPVTIMQDVLANESYSDFEKALLFFMSRERFRNRRRMAYISVTMLIIIFAFVALGLIWDRITHAQALANCLGGLDALPADLTSEAAAAAARAAVETACTQFPFSALLERNWEFLSWIGTFFTSVVALYYGAASFRPTS